MIEDRKSQAKVKYNDLQEKRNKLVKEAQEILDEMHRLEGEYRAYESLEVDEKSPEPNVKVEGE